MSEPDSIVMETSLPDPPAKIWRVLTEPPLLRAFLMEGDFTAVVGHRATLHGRPGHWDGSVECEVVEVEPLVRLVYHWRCAVPSVAHGRDTCLTWTLAPLEGGTRVRMEQSGFRADERAQREAASRTWQRSFTVFANVCGWLVA